MANKNEELIVFDDRYIYRSGWIPDVWEQILQRAEGEAHLGLLLPQVRARDDAGLLRTL